MNETAALLAAVLFLAVGIGLGILIGTSIPEVCRVCKKSPEARDKDRINKRYWK